MYVTKECDTVVIDGPAWETGKRDDITNAEGSASWEMRGFLGL